MFLFHDDSVDENKETEDLCIIAVEWSRSRYSVSAHTSQLQLSQNKSIHDVNSGDTSWTTGWCHTQMEGNMSSLCWQAGHDLTGSSWDKSFTSGRYRLAAWLAGTHMTQ